MCSPRLQFAVVITAGLMSSSPSFGDAVDDYHAMVAPCKRVLHESDFKLVVPAVRGRNKLVAACETREVHPGPRKGKETQFEVRFICHTSPSNQEKEPIQFHARKIIYFSKYQSGWRFSSAQQDLLGLPPETSKIWTNRLSDDALGPLLEAASKCLSS